MRVARSLSLAVAFSCACLDQMSVKKGDSVKTPASVVDSAESPILKEL